MNGVIIIDKPEGWTSHDVVGKLRGVLHERRIGHGGTLDPMATGVLPVFVGRGTRAVEFCENAEKEYVAGLRPGMTTDTQDITGNILSENSAEISKDELLGALLKFTGEIEQVPPMYSAVKIGGKKLYELARKGVEVERKPRRITIKSLSVEGETENGYLLKVVCSKGTYVRTLCHDIGAYLGCGAVMDSLRRVRAGSFTIDEAVSIDCVRELMEKGEIDKVLKPVDSLFSEYPKYHISGKREKLCRCGTEFKASELSDGTYRVYGESGEFLMLGKAEDGIMKTIKSFFEVAK